MADNGKEVILDMTLPRRWIIESTLSPQEVEELDKDVIEERHKYQEEKHKSRKESLTWSREEWIGVAQTYEASGFLHSEAVYLADEGVSPDSQEGTELMAKRQARVQVYMWETEEIRDREGWSEAEHKRRAIVFLAEELIRHNRSKGNTDDYMFSESTVA